MMVIGNVVPENVKYHVREYLDAIDFALLDVFRKSEHPADNYLYIVVGRNQKTGQYAWWAVWNESTQSLNHGHYGYSDYIRCLDDAQNAIYRMK